MSAPQPFAYPLAEFKGASPPAPGWFHSALAVAPVRSTFDVDGVAIELLTWGRPSARGLLFLHGDSAHADWWSFVAPFFADDWRCAAISWSGMGGSGWRPRYEFADWANEAVAALDAAGLDTAILVAHSLGGYPALLASTITSRIRGVITVDSAILPPHRLAQVEQPTPRPQRVYATQQEALARFRFMPPTLAPEPYLADHVARHGLAQVEGGWSWRFDTQIWGNMATRTSTMTVPRDAGCPVAAVLGGRSTLIEEEVLAHMRPLYPDDAPFVVVPEAGHHVMIDQPLALVAALRGLLAVWPA